ITGRRVDFLVISLLCAAVILFAYDKWWRSGPPITSVAVLPLARAAAEHAIRLDPDLAEAHFALGEINKFEWKWQAAEQEFRTGTELNPSDTIGLMLYVDFLTAMGRSDEAIEIGMRAVDLDPFSAATYTELGLALLMAGRREDAYEHYEKALQLDPDSYWAQWLMAESHTHRGEYQKAAPYMENIRRALEYIPPSMAGLLGHLYAIAGRQDDARTILSNLLARREIEFIPASNIAYVYAGLKDYDAALAWLEVAYKERNPQLTWLNQDYLWNGLREDPRFQDILAHMNFPEP
ncbi:MAG: tetratricopeptide repeat protein, partial [Gammaproteobacteria bacterium]|nr:tetratricopeptide repeat protein [Gammaproteobacteria bacterium]